MRENMNIACNPATFDALRKILDHESIEFTTGVGPGCLAIVIERKQEKRFKQVIQQWDAAIQNVKDQIK